MNMECTQSKFPFQFDASTFTMTDQPPGHILVSYRLRVKRERERDQQDAINLMFIIKLLSQHVSGIIMPIIRRTRVCTAAYGVLHC